MCLCHELKPFNELISVYFMQHKILANYSAGNYIFKVNNRNTRTRCKICSKLTVKAAE